MASAGAALTDDVFVRTPDPERVTVEYTVARRWPWPRLARVRRTFDFYPLPLWQLMAVDIAYDKSRSLNGGGLTLVHMLAPIIGHKVVRELPIAALEACWDAHARANLIPKVQAPRGPATDSPTARSSDASRSTPSASDAGRSSA
jgi:hypothetical protein